MTFDASGVPTLHGATDVDVDATAGTVSWSPIANGRFDQRRFDDSTGANPYWTLTGTAAVQATSNAVTKQQLVLGGTNTAGSAAQKVTLPNGTYTLGFDYKTQGVADHASVSVAGNGATVSPVQLTAPQTSFAHRTVTFTVTTGTVTITASVDSAAWSQLQIDDVSLWRS
jgi:hypothetical protein